MKQTSEELFLYVHFLLEKGRKEFCKWFDSKYVELMQHFNSVDSCLPNEYFQETNELIELIKKLYKFYSVEEDTNDLKEVKKVKDSIKSLVKKYENSKLKSEIFNPIEYKNLGISVEPISPAWSDSSVDSATSSSCISEDSIYIFSELPDSVSDDEDGNYSLYKTRP